MVINPGSHIGNATVGEGWTNTYARARAEAESWLERMREDGFADLELLDATDEPAEVEGRWHFTFQHTVTGASVVLETHGIDDIDAYRRKHIFTPRIYWNGSSCGEPCLDDFEAEGYEPVMTFKPRDTEKTP